MKGPIMITGGDNGKVFAAIGATYPKGSTCICSNKFFDKMIKGQTGTADGVFASVDTHITSEAYIPVVAGVTYTVNAPSVNPGDTAGENGVVFFKEDKSFLSHSTFGSETYVYFAAPADAAYMKLNFYVKTQPETMYTDISVLSGEKEKVLKAKNTSGAWIFTVPFVGTWCITSTDGANANSKFAAITSEGQNENVELNYSYYLFKSGAGYQNGHTLTKVVGTMTVADDSSYLTSDRKDSSNPGRAYFSPVDVTKYSTLEIDYMITNKQGTTDHFGLVADKSKLPTSGGAGTYVSKIALITDANVRKTATLSLSDINGEHYIAWSQSCTFNIYNLRLY